jgi:two-component system sensor histidine kinase KdpD
MLEEAQALKAKGRDVVIGLVETHKRSETEILRQGLVSIPLRHIEYGGITLEEMDLDAVLERRPEVVLVDELAHTNAAGSRHNKRYQDVEELLDAGIGVFTTVNIQHIESLNDTIFQITGVKVEETIPDSIIERANDIKLVDLPIETLFQRLHEGKVYIPEQAKKAMERFFQKGPLLGLRELSLRYTARKVDAELRSYMVTHAILGPWPAGSRLLVCVSQSPLSERAIRATHQLASDLRAEWFAAYVESPNQVLKSIEQEQLSKNLHLVERLGGKIAILTGERAADEIISFARDSNITLMLVGAPRRSVWRELISGSVVYDLMRRSGSIDMLVVGSSDIKEKAQYRQFTGLKYDWRRIVGSIILLLTMTAICWILKPGLEFVNIAMLFLVPIIISSILWGRLAGITTSILAVAILDFFCA